MQLLKLVRQPSQCDICSSNDQVIAHAHLSCWIPSPQTHLATDAGKYMQDKARTSLIVQVDDAPHCTLFVISKLNQKPVEQVSAIGFIVACGRL